MFARPYKLICGEGMNECMNVKHGWDSNILFVRILIFIKCNEIIKVLKAYLKQCKNNYIHILTFSLINFSKFFIS